MGKLKEEIIQSLIDQKEIFGDELFEEIRLTKIEQPAEKQTDENIINEASGDEEWQNAETLEQFEAAIQNCTKCELHKGRTNLVFGVGNPNADVMVIGEGPGAEEDKQGEPFVGRAGKLLNDILKAINFNREEVYIANIVKSRPPGNRTPMPSEMQACIPYLIKQINLIKPKVILCLGLTAAKGLLRKNETLTNFRGKVFDYINGTKVMVTYHPAALLRNPGWKRGCWEDVQAFRKLYDEIMQKQN